MREGWQRAAGRVARLLPPSIADRVFMPSWHEQWRRHLVAVRRARSWPGRCRVHVTTALALLSIAAQSARIANQERRARRTLALAPVARRGVDPMMLQDLRFAVRMLWKRPGFSSTAVAVLALSIGANTAIFSLVHGVLLRPLPYAQPERIVAIHETTTRGRATVSPPNFADWRAQNSTFAAMDAYDSRVVTLSEGASPERIDAAFVGGAVFDVLGVRPLLGRTFSRDELRVGGPAAVILGHALWQRRFGRDPGIVGRSILIDAKPRVVAGVMPAGFDFPDGFELWMPLVFRPDELVDGQRGAHYVEVIGRLKAGVTREQAEADIAAIESRIAAEHPDVQGYGIWLEPIYDAVVGEYRRPLWMLLGAVGFVLLIGCANISNLLLARGASRRTEIGVRTALGAGRWRIVRQLLAESTILSVAGGLAGIVLAFWVSRLLTNALPADVPRGAAVALDMTVLLFTAVVSIGAGILFGLAPAIDAARSDLLMSLKEGRRDGSAGGSRRGLRSALVTAEVALALVLLAGAGLTLRSFDRLSRIETGFDASGALVADVVLPEASYSDFPSVVRFYQRYLDALSQQPGVTSVGAVAIPPLARGGFGGTFSLIGKPEPAEEPRMAVRAATPGYLEVARIPLLRGRTITAADRTDAPHVAVISEAAAKKYWPGEDPIGRRIRIHVSTGISEVEREIVGVVGDVRAGRIESAASPLVYVPHAQYPFEFMTLFVRGDGDPMALAPVVRSQLAAIDPQVAIGSMRRGEALVSDAVAQPRFRMVLLGAFAATALALAALGLYGVMSFLVDQRRGEIGLRIALGANPSEVVGLVLRQGVPPVVTGTLLGLTGSVALAGVMRGLLFEVEPFDPLTFGLAAVLLAGVALAACYIPARRAAAVDPLVALRTE